VRGDELFCKSLEFTFHRGNVCWFVRLQIKFVPYRNLHLIVLISSIEYLREILWQYKFAWLGSIYNTGLLSKYLLGQSITKTVIFVDSFITRLRFDLGLFFSDFLISLLYYSQVSLLFFLCFILLFSSIDHCCFFRRWNSDVSVNRKVILKENKHHFYIVMTSSDKIALIWFSLCELKSNYYKQEGSG